MRPFAIQEIEASRGDTFLYRALMAILSALNAIVATHLVGTATLEAGVATVPLSCLGPTSRIGVSYEAKSGVVGVLSVDPLDFNFPAKTFKIRSSSVNDTSNVSWRHWA